MLIAGKSIGAVAVALRMRSHEVYKGLADAGESVRDIRAERRLKIEEDIASEIADADIMNLYGCTKQYIDNIKREMLNN